MSRRRRIDGERGAITILVLWGMVLVFMLLAAADFTTRGEVRIAGNRIAAARARLAAEAGTQLGLDRLLRRRAAGTILFDGTPELWRDGATPVSIAILDEAGKIDINNAPLALLAGLFRAVGRRRADALLLACGIVEHRGGNDAGCPAPILAGAAAPRRARPFVAPEQLAELPGFGPRLYGAIADDVTVASGSAAIDPAVAPRTVLLAIPGATPDLVDSYLADRKLWRRSDFAGASLAFLPMARYFVATPARDFTIVAVARTPSGARFRADLEVRLTGLARTPYHVLAWRAPSIRPSGQR